MELLEDLEVVVVAAVVEDVLLDILESTSFKGKFSFNTSQPQTLEFIGQTCGLKSRNVTT